MIQTPYIIDVDEGVEIRSKLSLSTQIPLMSAPARLLGLEVFVSNNGQDWEPGENSGAVFSLYTSRPDSGLEASEYYDKCTVCKPGFFDEDPERPNLEGKLTDEVYPIQCATLLVNIKKTLVNSNAMSVLWVQLLATVSNRIVQIAAASSRQNDCTCINKELSPDGESSFYKDTTSEATLDPLSALRIMRRCSLSRRCCM